MSFGVFRRQKSLKPLCPKNDRKCARTLLLVSPRPCTSTALRRKRDQHEQQIFKITTTIIIIKVKNKQNVCKIKNCAASAWAKRRAPRVNGVAVRRFETDLPALHGGARGDNAFKIKLKQKRLKLSNCSSIL